MKKELGCKIEAMRKDYSNVVGIPFNFFFCPILNCDDDVPLCKAHIINKAFSNSNKKWTVQRKDVDNFYGSHFESDFTVLPHMKNTTPTDVLGNLFAEKSVIRKLKPKITLDGKLVEYFPERNSIPKHYSHFELHLDGAVIALGVKMCPTEVISSRNRHWELSCSKDIIIPSIVSLIKAAHLSLFEMLGYRYVFSRTGKYIGNQLLGEFYRRNYMKNGTQVIESSRSFFRTFTNAVRPIVSNKFSLQGSISDKFFFVCWNKCHIWAQIILIKTDAILHAVLLPNFDGDANNGFFEDFLENPTDSISVSICKLEEDAWTVDENRFLLNWPKGY